MSKKWKPQLYASYSSDSQSEQSVESQIQVCKDYAEKNEIIVIDTYIDREMTGANDNRVAFQKMLLLNYIALLRRPLYV